MHHRQQTYPCSCNGQGIVHHGPGDWTICAGCLTGRPPAEDTREADQVKRQWLQMLRDTGGEG